MEPYTQSSSQHAQWVLETGYIPVNLLIDAEIVEPIASIKLHLYGRDILHVHFQWQKEGEGTWNEFNSFHEAGTTDDFTLTGAKFFGEYNGTAGVPDHQKCTEYWSSSSSNWVTFEFTDGQETANWVLSDVPVRLRMIMKTADYNESGGTSTTSKYRADAAWTDWKVQGVPNALLNKYGVNPNSAY